MSNEGSGIDRTSMLGWRAGCEQLSKSAPAIDEKMKGRPPLAASLDGLNDERR
jgi:hypothetical protein